MDRELPSGRRRKPSRSVPRIPLHPWKEVSPWCGSRFCTKEVFFYEKTRRIVCPVLEGNETSEDDDHVAMFMAISVVLGYFTIEAGPYLKIGLGSVANQFVYYLFGPVTGMFYAGILDILKFTAKPTGAFFPGFTLIAMLGAMIYGTVLYRRPITFGRVLFAKLLVLLSATYS